MVTLVFIGLLGVFSYHCAAIYKEFRGASPIFTINDAGRCFLNMGAWRSKKETEKNNREQMKVMKVNNKLVVWSIITTIVIGILTSLVTWYCSKS